MTYSLSSFSFCYFFYSKFCLIYLFQFFFVKRSNNFFTIKIANDVSGTLFFTFLNTKNLFRSIRNKIFFENFFEHFFIFWYSYMITNFKFSIFLIIFLSESIYVLNFIFTSVILIVLWYVLLYLLTISSNLSIYTNLHKPCHVESKLYLICIDKYILNPLFL